MARMVVVAPEYTKSKYRLEKLKDLETLIPQRWRSTYPSTTQ
jgi:hypothetical protein